MKKKPELQSEVAVSYSFKNASEIFFYATSDALEDLKEFGQIVSLNGHEYKILVDKRYKFDDVLEYIENYG